MLFNSLDFAFFLPIVFFIYWFIAKKNITIQNLFILIASYFFYGWWNWKFLALILISSSVDYLVGLGLLKYKRKSFRKTLLLTSIFINIGFLGFFKYYNFFIDSFIGSFCFFGISFDPDRLSILLPVGISFYTFQTLSYSIDVYYNRIKPTRSITAFFAFVAFFPQLVAGPIERAKNLLPQFSHIRVFNYNKASDGMRQILWGFFKKLVIADNCASIVNVFFENHSEYSGSSLLMGLVLFSFQIYCDFSGYSDIAIGTAKLFGFNLMQNFAFPYFSRDIAEFWRRWHISLTTWFRDYIYIPLGGSRVHTWKKIRNIFFVFLISGFWHGANWTFIVWGLVHALYFLPFMLLNINRAHVNAIAEGKLLFNLKEFLQILSMFFMVTIAWVFFRAETVRHAFSYLDSMFSYSLLSIPQLIKTSLLFPIAVLLTFEWFQRNKRHALQLGNIHCIFRRLIYIFVFCLIFFLGVFNEKEFIYFQF